MSWKKVWVGAAILALLAACGSATLLTGTLQYGDGTKVNGVLTLTPNQRLNVLTTGSCGGPYAVTPANPPSLTIFNGTPPAGASIVGNDCVSPSSSYYNARLVNTQGQVVLSEAWKVTGASVNIANILPLLSPGAAPITLNGDVTGDVTASIVSRLQGTPLSAAAPLTGQILLFNGTTWLPGNTAGTGTVTSVGLSLPASVFAVAGSPITGAGVLAGTFANQTANQVFAGPTSGVPAVPTFRLLVATDIPAIAESGVTNLVTDLAAKVPTTRLVSAGAGLTGGGDLSADRTLSVGAAAVTDAMMVSAPTSLNTASTIVKRDASGNFAAGAITANLTGTVTGNATGFTGALAGDVTGTQAVTVVGAVGGSTAANVNAATVLANAATSANTANAIVRRDGSGNFAAGTITGTLAGNATNVTGTVAIATGGTGQTSASAAFNALNPMTTTGDIIIETGAATAGRLAGNAGATKQFLTSTGTGVVANAPAWGAIASGDVPNIAESQVTSLVADLALKAPTARNVNTTLPLTGGGTLAGDLTLGINLFSAVASGTVAASGGGTTNFLRADGTWTAPAGSGTVTSVGLALPSIFAVSGSPVTSTGTLTGTLSTQTANLIFSGPSSGGAATPAFRLLAATDIPNIAESQVTSLVADLAAKVPTTRNVNTAAPLTGGGALSADLSLGINAVTAGVAGTAPASGGGTVKFLRADATWVSAVQSVGLSLPGEFTVSGSPVTGTGTLTATIANQTANQVFAGPTSGVPAVPTFRSLVDADVPAIPESRVTSLVADLALKTPTSRLINTTAPLAGGGDLTGDRPLSLTLNGGGCLSAAAGLGIATGCITDSFLASSTGFVKRDGSTALTAAWNVGNQNLGLNIAPTFGVHLLGGSARFQALATPGAPSVTPMGTTGSTTYTYNIVAVDRNGFKTLASAAGQTTIGNAVLSVTNFNRIAWSAVAGATGYDVTKNGLTQSLVTNISTTSLDDTGQATSAYTAPARNTTGDLTIDGQLSVGTIVGTIVASALKSATTNVDVSAAAAPTANQVLAASSGTAAVWVSPAPSGPVVGTGRVINSGTGLSGGGDLTADRTLAVVTVPSGSPVGTARLVSTGAGLTGGGDLTADRTLSVVTVPSGSPVGTARAITAGAGLTGGGDLTADRSFSISAGAVTDAMLSTSYVKADGTRPLTANWAAGQFAISAINIPTIRRATAYVTGGTGLTQAACWTSGSGTGGIQEAYNALPTNNPGLGIVEMPAGFYCITAPINASANIGTNWLVGGAPAPSSGPRPVTFRGEGSSNTVLIGQTKGQGGFAASVGPVFDVTGAGHVQFQNFAIVGATPNPSTVGIYFARSTGATSRFTQNNGVRDVYMWLPNDAAANNTNGTVGVYGRAVETSLFENNEILADNPYVFTGQNTFGISSPNQSENTADLTCAQNGIQGGYVSGFYSAVVIQGLCSNTSITNMTIGRQGSATGLYALKVLADSVTPGNAIYGMHVGPMQVEQWDGLLSTTAPITALRLNATIQQAAADARPVILLSGTNAELRQPDINVSPTGSATTRLIGDDAPGSNNGGVSGGQIHLYSPLFISGAKTPGTANVITTNHSSAPTITWASNSLGQIVTAPGYIQLGQIGTKVGIGRNDPLAEGLDNGTAAFITRQVGVAVVNAAGPPPVTNNDLNIGSATEVRLVGATASYVVTGFNGGVDGRWLSVISTAAQPWVLQNESASSAVNNRVLTGTGRDMVLPAAVSTAVTLRWDLNASRWQVMAVMPQYEGTMFTGTADKVVANTTVETSMMPTGQGTLTVPSLGMVSGRVLRIALEGFGGINGTGTVNFRVKLGTVTLVTTGAVTPTAFAANRRWKMEIMATCRTAGATGTVMTTADAWYYSAAQTKQSIEFTPNAAQTVDTRINNAVDVTAQFSVADPANTLTTVNATVELLN